MFEAVQVFWGAAVLYFLVSIHQNGREAATWTRRVHERLVDQLTFLLFRTPDPTKEDQGRRIDGIMRYLHLDDFDELSDQARALQMVDGHPIVVMLWDVAREAYRDAQEIALSSGKFNELSQDKQDKIRDEFWYSLASRLRLKLPGRAWLFETAPARDEYEWHAGEIPSKVGDVILVATGLNPEFAVPAYRVGTVEHDGDQTGRPVGEFRSRPGAEAVALRVGAKTRIVERRQNGQWAVIWAGR